MEFNWNTVVLQPTSICNLNCRYCYLPDRRAGSRIRPDVVRAVVRTISKSSDEKLILWHGGEPLATGREPFRNLVDLFETARLEGKCRHSLQTNATLITDEWCDLFRNYSFRVGVSIDGYEKQNADRVTWGGKSSFVAAVAGIKRLRENGIPFSVIAVVSSNNIGDPKGFYEFLCSLKPCSISLNIEEKEGLNDNAQRLFPNKVKDFWSILFSEWIKNPTVPIRQFRDAFNVVRSMQQGSSAYVEIVRNFYPTISTEGDVVLLSPELIAAKPSDRARFIVGNVREQPLESIIESGMNAWYVREFFEGVTKCQAQCQFFRFCRGGQASNKFFEHGRLDCTETDYCKHSRIAPAATVIEHLLNTKNRREEVEYATC